MKKPMLAGTIIFSLAAVSLLIFVTTYMARNYLTARNTGDQSAECTAKQMNHIVTIENEQMKPNRVEAAFCDKLTIINRDGRLRSISFGEHDKHISYDGVSEAILAQDKSLMINLNKPGNFVFHDHYQQSVRATFLVRE